MFKAAEAKIFRILASRMDSPTSYFVSFARTLKKLFSLVWYLQAGFDMYKMSLSQT